MTKINNSKLGLIALFIYTSMTAMADDSFTWSGYLRTGTGLNSDGKIELTNENYLGRFGNEYDSWITSKLNKKVTGKNGSWAVLSLETFGYLADPSLTGNLLGPDKTNGISYIGETTAKFGGLDFLPEGATLKVGQFGIVEDIHILDYKFKNVKGTGAVYNNNKENKLQLAFVINEPFNSKSVDGEYTIGNIDTKLTVSQKLDDSDLSVSALVAYNQNKLLGMSSGRTKYIAQIGIGVQGEYLSRNVVTNVDDSAYRFIVDGHGNIGEVIVNPVLWVEGTNYGDSQLDNYTSITAGGRVTQSITENLKMMYEGFVNIKENNKGVATADGTQYKISAGPVIQLYTGEWVRPAARFTATYIGGDHVQGDDTNFKKDGEFRFGTQIEAWF